MAIPPFAFVASNIIEHAQKWLSEPGVSLGNPLGLATAIGREEIVLSLWIVLFLNLVLQWVCIKGVFMLTSAAGTLTTTLVITLRKFISLVFSIMYFDNPFTSLHWTGTCLVFIGILVYSSPTAPRAPKTSGGNEADAQQIQTDPSRKAASLGMRPQWPTSPREQPQEEQQQTTEATSAAVAATAADANGHATSSRDNSTKSGSKTGAGIRQRNAALR